MEKKTAKVSFHLIFLAFISNAQKESKMQQNNQKKENLFLGEQKNRFLCLPTFFMKLLFAVIVCCGCKWQKKCI